jgi:membrane-associated phospholipid phosphatase
MNRRFILYLMLGCPLYARGDMLAVEQRSEAANQSVYRIHPVMDGTIIGVAALGATLPIIFEPQIIKKQCPCDSGEVNRIDRPVIQYHSPVARTAGDITVGLALAIPPLLDGMDIGFKNQAFMEDLVVYAEVLSVNSSISNAFRYTTQRPRPDTYRISPRPSQPGGFASFYSGHTSSVFAGLSAASMTYNLRYGPHVWPWIVTAGVGLGESATRILSGRHFYTDVAAGIAAGTAVGTLIPYLHERNKHSTISIMPQVSPESVQLVFRRDF